MTDDANLHDVASALQVGIGLFVRRLRQSAYHADLSQPEMSALSRLDRAGTATTSDLARVARIAPRAMGVTRPALERRGLVERRPDPTDGRRMTMSVTAAGRKTLWNR